MMDKRRHLADARAPQDTPMNDFVLDRSGERIHAL